MTADWQTWNDGTVPQMAQTIFDGKRYDLMPILADALEESEWPGDAAPFRQQHTNTAAVRMLAPIIGGELAESVAWLVNFADLLGPGEVHGGGSTAMTYEDLMGFAQNFVATDDGKWGGEHIVQNDSEHWRSVFWDQGKEFWRHYQNVTGETVKSSEQSLFCCTC